GRVDPGVGAAAEVAGHNGAGLEPVGSRGRGPPGGHQPRRGRAQRLPQPRHPAKALRRRAGGGTEAAIGPGDAVATPVAWSPLDRQGAEDAPLSIDPPRPPVRGRPVKCSQSCNPGTPGRLTRSKSSRTEKILEVSNTENTEERWKTGIVGFSV